jgi:transmembrane sensor
VGGKGSPGSASGAAAPRPVVTPEIAAEAATWVARLHGPSRSRAMELGCLEWQARSAAHRHAFERCTETWMEIPNVAQPGTLADAGRAQPAEPGGGAGTARRGWLLAFAWAVLTAALLLVWQPWSDALDYRTAIGEAQTVLLADGTRMSLNTDTRVRVQLDARRRLVRVDAGEAEFEVAKDTARAFVVHAAGSDVVATGTVFSVRVMPPGNDAGAALAVTLIEGEVAVRQAADGWRGRAAKQPLLMRPGDRVVLARHEAGATPLAPRLDRPPLEQVTAWKRNEVVFDQASLAEAVAEMNRYSRTPMVLLGPLASMQWRVSGRFRTGDNAAFAGALASLHGLVVHERQGRLELSRGP